MLKSVIAYPFLNPDVDLFSDDQSALIDILDESDYFAPSTVYCPSRWCNPYRRSENGELPTSEPLPDDMLVHPGDLLVHLPGTEKLGANMYPYITISKEERPDWSMSLKDTGYIEDTRYIEDTALFWEKFSLSPIENE
jgi:hypothetical protein